MRKLFSAAFVFSLCLIAAGCGDPKADASSEDAFKKSIEEMEKPLDSAKKEKLVNAVGTLMMKHVLLSVDEAASKKAMKETFDGKTADEIIAAGEAAKSETDAEMKKMMNGK